jgi:hypothetical protein
MKSDSVIGSLARFSARWRAKQQDFNLCRRVWETIGNRVINMSFETEKRFYSFAPIFFDLDILGYRYISMHQFEGSTKEFNLKRGELRIDCVNSAPGPPADSNIPSCTP